ncbi:MAG: DUF4410 domain-containing protein [Thermoanaerobaculia bacterium]
MKTMLTRAVVLCALFTLALPLLARGRKAGPTEPGTYKDWGGEVDQLVIESPFHLSDYQFVRVEEFDTSETPLPEEKDNTYAPVKKVLADVSTPFVKGLEQELGDRLKIDSSTGEPGAGTIVIRGKIETMDPGSKAARYWAGFGAGAARTRIVGEAIDASSGKVLFHFTQERRSGVGMMGGDYVGLMDRNLSAIGKDVAGVLKAF